MFGIQLFLFLFLAPLQGQAVGTDTAEPHPLEATLRGLPADGIDSKAMDEELKSLFAKNKSLSHDHRLIFAGGHSGGGGDLRAAKHPFTNRGEEILRNLKDIQRLPQAPKVEKLVKIKDLEKALATTRIVYTPGPLFNQFGQPVDALNLPRSKVILVTKKLEDELRSIEPSRKKAATRVVLHEYFGILAEGNEKSLYYEGSGMTRSGAVIHVIPAYASSCSDIEKLFDKGIRLGWAGGLYAEKLLTQRDALYARKKCTPARENSDADDGEDVPDEAELSRVMSGR
jgi:hypothetical protein